MVNIETGVTKVMKMRKILLVSIVLLTGLMGGTSAFADHIQCIQAPCEAPGSPHGMPNFPMPPVGPISVELPEILSVGVDVDVPSIDWNKIMKSVFNGLGQIVAPD